MKRYDGVSTFPDDLVNQGAPTQESIVTAQGKAFWVNENGAWVSEGGAPKKISSFTVDNIIKSCSDTDLLKVGAGTDEEHVLFSFPSVTMDGEVYANIALKYNIIQNTWDIRQYPSQHPFYTSYVDTNKTNYLVAGDNDGSVFIIDKGTTDNGTPISYSLETHDLYFGFRLFLKDISRVGFITSGTSKAEVMWRNSNNADDWKQLGTITSDEHLFQNLSLKGSRYNFKITETTDSGRVTIKSIEFPEGIKVFDNTK